MALPPNHGLKWLPDDDTNLRRLAAEGKTFTEIAEALGRREAAVKVRAAWLGIEKPRHDA